ncbi:hypothetical protein K502DRAFT_98111 [Neoconidiobolus thromboides FSU 785]|nr:hypothetical protein K502DRAFT_98111 [Neoconidiobolus thromboides FSU 785]
MQMLTQEQLETIDRVGLIVLILSFTSSVLVLLIVLVSRLLKLRGSQRLSYRLQLWISLADILFCIAYSFPIFISNDNIGHTNSIMEIRFFQLANANIPIFCQLWYMLLIFFIILTLHFTLFLKNSRYVYLFNELNIVITTFLISLLFILPSFIICWVNNKYTVLDFFPIGISKFLILWLQLNLVLFIISTYCTIMVVKISILLLNYKKALDAIYLQNTSQSLIESYIDVKANQVINKNLCEIVLRVIFYAIIPITTQFIFVVISSYYTLSKERNSFGLRIVYDSLNFLNGLLNSLFFLCFDPALPSIFKEFITIYIRKESYENLQSCYSDKINI